MIPAGTKGFLRIPLNEENFENFSEIALTKVSQMEIFFQMPGCLKGSAVYLDDFGLIGGAETELVQIDDYLETDTVVLNEGERFKLLSGFEDDDAAKLAADKVIAGSVEVAAEGANNGDKAADAHLYGRDSTGLPQLLGGYICLFDQQLDPCKIFAVLCE